MSLAPLPNQPQKSPRSRWKTFLHDYAWWILKNVLGWLLILIAPILGAALPGPGGIPIFLIGFAMITFPGKRALTARVFRGMPIDLSGNAAGVASGMGACLLPLIAAIVLRIKFESLLTSDIFRSRYLLGIVLGSVAFSFLLSRLALRLANLIIRLMPLIRRKARPWMRHHGIDLLPPRRRRRLRLNQPDAVDMEILEFAPRHGERALRLWRFSKPWLIGGAVALLVFAAVKVIL